MVKIYLGNSDKKNIFWSPIKEKNPHFLVVGTSGSGKTETLKTIVYELSNKNIPVMIIDFHQDFEDVCENVMDFKNITINPLDYSPQTPELTMYKVSHILKKVFNLGVQQEGILQDAIQKSYLEKNINMKETKLKKSPTFGDVKNILELKIDELKENKRSTQTIETLLVRLRPLFNTGFFSAKKSINFSEIFKQNNVLKLKDMPTDEVKYAIAEFFLNKLKYELYSKGKTDKIILYCIIDEAHRLLDEKSPLNDLLRESRKYGTGVILSSQRPSDFSEIVLANIGGFITFQCRLDKDAIFIAKQMKINFEEIKGLTEAGSGFVNFSSDTSVKKIKIKPLWKRKPKIEFKSKLEKPSKEKIPYIQEPEKIYIDDKRNITYFLKKKFLHIKKFILDIDKFFYGKYNLYKKKILIVGIVFILISVISNYISFEYILSLIVITLISLIFLYNKK